MEAAVASLAAIFDLNTDLLLNCLSGLSEADAQAQLPGGGNSICFLAAHLTDTRHYLVTQLGRPLANPLAGHLEDARSIDEIRTWPPLSDLRHAWLTVGGHLAHTLASLSGEELRRPIKHRLSLDGTELGLIAFLAQHDSYHLGQAAFVRRQLGKSAMSYARAERPGAPAGAA